MCLGDFFKYVCVLISIQHKMFMLVSAHLLQVLHVFLSFLFFFTNATNLANIFVISILVLFLLMRKDIVFSFPGYQQLLNSKCCLVSGFQEVVFLLLATCWIT